MRTDASGLPLSHRATVAVGAIATLATLFGTAGEFSMLWSPTGGYVSYENFLYASPERSRLGFFLGVLAVPLYFLGYLMIFQALDNVSRALRWTVLLAATYSFAAGNVWLGSRALLAAMIRRGDVPDLVQLVTEITEPVLNLVRLLVVLFSVLLIWLIARGKTRFPRWFALFSPGLLLALVFLSYIFLPSIGNYLLPPAMNLVHAVFFGIGTVLFARRPSPPLN